MAMAVDGMRPIRSVSDPRTAKSNPQLVWVSAPTMQDGLSLKDIGDIYCTFVITMRKQR